MNPPTDPAAAVADLSPRQRQILDLLQAGKVNKEIANELGIGLGTVKQHVVALFKKLNVKNRAMAVSRGLDRRPALEERSSLIVDGMLERRPCVVLSLALPEDAEPSAVRRLHGILASLAFDSEAVFLARKGNAGDVIFGAQRCSEHDLLKALEMARAVHRDLGGVDSDLASRLRGGVSAGLAVASMNRYGGWTGEAIASAAIASARELLLTVSPGQLAFGVEARDLMQAFGIGRGREIAEAETFAGLASLCWTGERAEHTLVGRERERGQLRDALCAAETGQGQVIRIEGETGMGKSSLCAELADMARSAGMNALYFRCLPGAADSEPRLYDRFQALVTPLTAALKPVHAVKPPILQVFDDMHLLPRGACESLERAAEEAAAQGALVLLSGRRHATEAQAGMSTIRLGRLPAEAIRVLVAGTLGEAAEAETKRVAEIVRCASGVPLFAVELARHATAAPPPLSLLIIVAMRLDNLGLDRVLLRALAGAAGPLTPAELAERMNESMPDLQAALDQTLASGVLRASADGRLDFSHPLIRQVIAYLAMDVT